MGKRLLFKTPEQRLTDLIKVRMKLGVYSKDDYGYVKLEETKDGDFTVCEHRRGKLITNPRKLDAEYVFKQAEFCEKNNFRFFPKYSPDQFGSIVNPKTGKLYQEFTANDWIEGNTENFIPVKQEKPKENHSEILTEFFGDWSE